MPRVKKAALVAEAGPSRAAEKRPKEVEGKQPAQKKQKPDAGAPKKTKSPKAPRTPKPKFQNEEEKVNYLLLQAGYKKPEKASKCVRAGLIRGNFGFKFTGEASQLDQVVMEVKCSSLDYCADNRCTGTLKATVRKLLKQTDYAGTDYEDGLESATVQCDTCEMTRSYVTQCCSKSKRRKPEWDNGKFHNHCDKCKGLGQCLGDYREEHCDNCGKHFWAGGDCVCSCQSNSDSEDDDGW